MDDVGKQVDPDSCAGIASAPPAPGPEPSWLLLLLLGLVLGLLLHGCGSVTVASSPDAADDASPSPVSRPEASAGLAEVSQERAAAPAADTGPETVAGPLACKAGGLVAWGERCAKSYPDGAVCVVGCIISGAGTFEPAPGGAACRAPGPLLCLPMGAKCGACP